MRQRRRPVAAPPEAGSLSDYKRTILSALEQLTGEDAGSTARHWRDRLRVSEADRRVPADPDRRIGWERPCVK